MNPKNTKAIRICLSARIFSLQDRASQIFVKILYVLGAFYCHKSDTSGSCNNYGSTHDLMKVGGRFFLT